MRLTAAGSRRWAILAGLALLLHGCAGTPFERWWPFQLPDPSGLSRAQPEQVRVALKLPLPARPRQDGATLVVRLSGANRGGAVNRFAMTLVNEGRTVRADRLPTADPGYRWYLFKLTPTAEDQLDALQSRMRGRDGPGYDQVDYTVALAYQNVGAGQSVSRSVRLQLADNEGFFTLADGDHTVGADAAERES